MSFVFDWTISIGTIVNTLVIAAAAVAAVSTMRSQLETLSTRMNDLEAEAKTQTTILVTIAGQEARLDAQQTRMDDLMRRLDRNPNCTL